MNKKTRKMRWFVEIGAIAMLAALAAPVAALAAPAATQTPTIQNRSDGSTIIGNYGFTATDAEEEGYWYSRYNLLSLVMQSGNGATFAPDPAVLGAAIQAVDSNPADGDTVTPPANPALLRIVYAGGDPHLATGPLNPDDFATLRWVGGNESVTTVASAWTIIKELEWAKQFHVDDHFGTPASDFGAQQRFVGMVMSLEAKAQLMTWLNDSSEFQSSLEGEAAMLLALSDASGLYAAAALPNSASNRYRDTATAVMFSQAADTQFDAVVASHLRTAKDLSVGIQSLVWYAANTGDMDRKAAALDQIANWGARLARTRAGNVAERAAKVRGLIEAGRVTGVEGYLTAAARDFHVLTARYDSRTGAFHGQSTYTTDDFGTVMGAINSARLFLGDRIDQVKAEAMFAGFFEGVANVGGLQISAPPIGLFKAPFEQEEPPLFLRYPDTPFPPAAGGTYGIAPVLAASATVRQGNWTVDQSFDTAGAMHTSNEMIWFHNDEVNGFPTP